ncbi:MAG: CDC48 family AAA ATPase [Candidatus Woesearchaeota archaeon]|jgi:transitional endoplasmic reticulum ATPase|nr:CDC48 family AAA ATPase [Candidatus Woesearchaeota archaeon]MDP7506334.1 CDC48 family AAA ATPase [Candidatus Woesearchaeota archaeon]|tara:strand:+ start:1278 stop:3806 length:2529 start_codon:yes stop_codon:yes gene_type:complete
MVNKELRFKVAEAIQDDVNKGIVRVDSNFMRTIGVKPGDIVEIEGERKTVGIVDRAYPGDIGLNIIRLDGIMRRNAKTGIGELVAVKKADIKEAKKIVIAPAKKGMVIRAPPDMIKQGLLGRALATGDIISLGGTGRRRRTMSDSPLFDDIFSVFDESMMGFGFGDIKFIVVSTLPKESVIVSDLTEVEFNPEAVEVEEEKTFDVTYEDIGGLETEIKKIREMVELPLKHPEVFERLGIQPPKGVLLHGPPGTGKTLLAKAVANETNSHFILINGPEVMSKWYGQSEKNIKEKFDEAEKNAPSIIFIDEIDAIAPGREEVHGEVERRVVAQLLAMMDGLKSRGKVVVIAATNIPNVIDPALRRPGRFDREIEIGVPGKKGRLNVLKIHTRNMPLAKDVNLKEIANITHGFVGADLAALCKEAAMIVLRKVLPDLKLEEEEAIPKELLEKLRITRNDFNNALKIVRPSAMREVLVEVPNVKWDNVGGLEEVKQDLKEAVEWPLKYPDSFKNLGVKPPKGILLYGPPGTGKTMLAKAVANESEANFISVKGPEVLSKWVNETPKLVRKLFKKARQVSPTIVFIDEIDSIANRRDIGTSSHHGGMSAVEALLTEMNGLEDINDVVIIGATNRPDILDPAILRPGRFDRIILTPAPDEKTRQEIFKVHTTNIPLMNKTLSTQLRETIKGLSTKIFEKHLSGLSTDVKKNGEEIELLKAYKTIIKSIIIQENNKPETNNKKDYDFSKLIPLLKEINDEKQSVIKDLSKKTDGYTGSDIESICREAAIITLRKDIKSKEVIKNDFSEALKKVKPSVTKEIAKSYEELRDFFKQARANQMKEEKPSYMG